MSLSSFRHSSLRAKHRCTVSLSGLILVDVSHFRVDNFTCLAQRTRKNRIGCRVSALIESLGIFPTSFGHLNASSIVLFHSNGMMAKG